ncbi:hypothetical protein [uncultured Hymenobacter sp.]|uniref:hypothetical protein n=1 Tax=uncultured Hymenobacter sp. TaxID=170016 RepID=UPI0035CC83CC
MPSTLVSVAELHLRFGQTRQQLMKWRQDRQCEFEAGKLAGFLPKTHLIQDNLQGAGGSLVV